MVTRNRIYLAKSEIPTATNKRLQSEVVKLRNELELLSNALTAADASGTKTERLESVNAATRDVEFLLVESETR